MLKVIDLKTMAECPVPPHCVLCLGNFDGIHIGHSELIRSTKQLKDRLLPTHKDVASGAWFFEKHPFEAISGKPVREIMSFEKKLEMLANYGLDYAFVANFSKLCHFTPERFVNDVLKDICHCIYAVCGFNFTFGVKGSGDASALVSLMDGKAHVVERVEYNGEIVSSSLIRDLISRGDIEYANELLGYSFSFKSKVLHGKEVGRRLGFPTINQCFPKQLIKPPNGIYITSAIVDGKTYPSVSNVGTRPTFDDGDMINCETYILDFNRSIYEMPVEIIFHRRIRDEMKFDSAELLKKQLALDVEKSRNYQNSLLP